MTYADVFFTTGMQRPMFIFFSVSVCETIGNGKEVLERRFKGKLTF